jgi:hypothetical protein
VTASAEAVRWLERAPAGWDALLAADPDGSPGHARGFVEAFAAVRPGCEPAYLVAGPDDAPTAGVPAVIERRAGLHWLHLLPSLLPATALAPPGGHAAADLACARAIAGRALSLGVVGGSWVVARHEAPAPAEAALAEVPGETRVLATAVVDLSAGVEAAWRRVERHARQEVRAALRRGLELAEEPGELESAHALYTTQARGWHGHAPLPIELARRLLAPSPGGAPIGRLFTARDRAGLLSAVLVLAGAHEWFAWWSGSHADARRRHAFGALLWHAAEQAALAGARRFNVGASAAREGVGAFKRSLGAEVRDVRVRWIAPAGAGPVGHLVAALQSRARRGRARGVAEAGQEPSRGTSPERPA